MRKLSEFLLTASKVYVNFTYIPFHNKLNNSIFVKNLLFSIWIFSKIPIFQVY